MHRTWISVRKVCIANVAFVALFACAASDDGAVALGQISSDAAAPPGMSLVVEPPSSPPVANLRGVDGAIIYMSWLQGRDVLSQAPGNPVVWAILPAFDAVDSVETIRLDTGIEPASLEVRLFQELGTDLTPIGDGTVHACSMEAQAECHFSVAAGTIDVSFSPPLDTVAIILAAQWYIPVNNRESVDGISDFDIVSWGFLYA